MGSFADILGINELKGKNNMWRCLLAEFIGNFILNFFGCGAVVSISPGPNQTANLVLIALAFGLAIFMAVSTIGHVSGGHLNPAVTVALLASRKITIVKAVLYIIVQCCGALAGSAVLNALTPEEVAGNLGMTTLGNRITALQAFGIEFFLGLILILVVFGVCDENKPDSRFLAPLAIGLTVTLGHLTAIDYTGSSMNPARSFGSAVISGIWENHWVYWLGPILGGIGGSLLYCQAFAAPPPAIPASQNKYGACADEKEMKRLDGASDLP